MMPSAETDAATAREWRNLQFFYERSDTERVWRFIGSRAGLLRIARHLRDYGNDPGNSPISEHHHYGPYLYLKFLTWHESQITITDIRGTLLDFLRLADVIERQLLKSQPGHSIIIDTEYSQKNEFSLRLEVREDGFDPASADPLLFGKADSQA
jgi:hypothetical protein